MKQNGSQKAFIEEPLHTPTIEANNPRRTQKLSGQAVIKIGSQAVH